MQWMNIREVAAAAGISISTLQRLRRAGAGPKEYHFLGNLRFSAGDVQQWITQSAAQPGQLLPAKRAGERLAGSVA